MRVHQSIYNVDHITGVIQRPPQRRHRIVKLPEDGASQDEDHVVQYRQRHHHQPLQRIHAYEKTIDRTHLRDIGRQFLKCRQFHVFRHFRPQIAVPISERRFHWPAVFLDPGF